MRNRGTILKEEEEEELGNKGCLTHTRIPREREREEEEEQMLTFNLFILMCSITMDADGNAAAVDLSLIPEVLTNAFFLLAKDDDTSLFSGIIM